VWKERIYITRLREIANAADETSEDAYDDDRGDNGVYFHGLAVGLRHAIDMQQDLLDQWEQYFKPGSLWKQFLKWRERSKNAQTITETGEKKNDFKYS